MFVIRRDSTHTSARDGQLRPSARIGIPISYQLSVISYQLSVISYQLSVISYQLSVISYQLEFLSVISPVLEFLSVMDIRIVYCGT
jgi:hypothetical protein